MKNQFAKSFFMACLVGLLSLSASAEQTSATLTRTSESDSKMSASLSKDIYRSVPYQDTYEEQEAYQVDETYYVDIPYTDTETYYEDVPYQEREAYTDTETYYDSEYRCHNVTEYERECRNERLCAPRPGEQVCREAEECGTNAHGQRICKTRKVCETGPSREDCQDRQVCNNVPRSRQQCGYEQVAKTRTVTKYRNVTRYRQEQRTRTVTKYRQEARTRTVTKYRTVTKCCVTRYREEFDHQWKLDLQVVFPAQAVLNANESEKFQVALAGSEAQPDANFTIVNSIYGYNVVRKEIRGQSGIIELALAPKYNESSLGSKTLEKIELIGQNEDVLNELVISDSGLKPRVQTDYNFRILEKASQKVAAEGTASSKNAIRGTISVKLAEALASDVDYVIQVSASRSGVVLEKPFSFSKTQEVRFVRWNEAEFGSQTVQDLKVLATKSEISLEFSDSGAHTKLVTQYKVIVLNQDSQEIWSQVVNAASVLDGKKATIALDEKVAASQEDLLIKLLVQRTGTRLQNPVQFEKSVEHKFISLEELKSSKKISGLGVKGRESSAQLVLKDEISDTSRIKTQYTVVITRHGGFLNLQKKVMGSVKFDQSQIKDGQFSIPFNKMGITNGALNDHFTAGSTIYLDLTATRVSEGKTLATIKKHVELKIQ